MRERIVTLGAITLARAAIDATLIAGRLGSSRSALEGVAAYFSYLAELADSGKSIDESGADGSQRLSFADFMRFPQSMQREWENDPIFIRQRADMYSAALAWSVAHQYVHAAIDDQRPPPGGNKATPARWLESPHDVLTIRLLKAAGLFTLPPVAALRVDVVLETRSDRRSWVDVTCRTLALSYFALAEIPEVPGAATTVDNARKELASQLRGAGCR